MYTQNRPYVPNFLVTGLVSALIWIISVNGQQYLQSSYDPSYEYQVPRMNNLAKVAIEKLKDSPQWVGGWDSALELGQVSAVSVDSAGRVHAFHRAGRAWGATTFDLGNTYQGPRDPIPDPTVVVVADNGTLLHMWGENMFYMPHGLTVDKRDNVWLTDVALHQVFKFTPDDHKKPALVLGTRFVPGDDEEHFCKPSAVAVLDSGDFFVADGYCNSRIVKYNSAGVKLLQFGKETAVSPNMPPPYSFFVPHGLTIAEKQGAVCVADRENGRVQCFHAVNGTFHSQYHSWLIGRRLFSVAYSQRDGGLLYIVNGLAHGVSVRGYVIDMTSGKLVQTFNPPGAGFSTPHDIAVSPDGQSIYVAELDPHKLHKFKETVDSRTYEENRTKKGGAAKMASAARVKPTATIEDSSVAWRAVETRGAWLGVAGGAAGGLGAVLLCSVLAAIALLRARRSGWMKARSNNRRRWDYAGSEFKLRRLLERPRGFQRVNTDESDEEPPPHANMLRSAPATA